MNELEKLKELELLNELEKLKELEEFESPDLQQHLFCTPFSAQNARVSAIPFVQSQEPCTAVHCCSVIQEAPLGQLKLLREENENELLKEKLELLEELDLEDDE